MKLSFNGTKVTVKIGSRIKTYPISASDCFLGKQEEEEEYSAGAMPRTHALVAQLVAQQTFNLCAAGSTPAEGI